MRLLSFLDAEGRAILRNPLGPSLSARRGRARSRSGFPGRHVIDGRAPPSREARSQARLQQPGRAPWDDGPIRPGLGGSAVDAGRGPRAQWPLGRRGAGRDPDRGLEGVGTAARVRKAGFLDRARLRPFAPRARSVAGRDGRGRGARSRGGDGPGRPLRDRGTSGRHVHAPGPPSRLRRRRAGRRRGRPRRSGGNRVRPPARAAHPRGGRRPPEPDLVAPGGARRPAFIEPRGDSPVAAPGRRRLPRGGSPSRNGVERRVRPVPGARRRRERGPSALRRPGAVRGVPPEGVRQRLQPGRRVQSRERGPDHRRVPVNLRGPDGRHPRSLDDDAFPAAADPRFRVDAECPGRGKRNPRRAGGVDGVGPWRRDEARRAPLRRREPGLLGPLRQGGLPAHPEPVGSPELSPLERRARLRPGRTGRSRRASTRGTPTLTCGSPTRPS